MSARHTCTGLSGRARRLAGTVERCALWRGFWQQPPSNAFLAALGGATVDELPVLDRLRDAVTEAGFEVTSEWFATDDSARYEETLAGNAGRHGGPNTLAYAQRIRHRGALPGGTDTLDFAVFVLRA